MKDMDLILGRERQARYKIEVFFQGVYSRNAPAIGVVSFWAMGAALSGDGDVKLYQCPGRYHQRNNCAAMMNDVSNDPRFFACPMCGTEWKHSEVIGELLFRLPLQRWAEVLQTYFVRLNMDADIVRKIDEQGIIKPTMQEREKHRKGELTDMSRLKRRKLRYPLANIIKDVNSGSTLVDRFYAFLRS